MSKAAGKARDAWQNTERLYTEIAELLHLLHEQGAGMIPLEDFFIMDVFADSESCAPRVIPVAAVLWDPDRNCPVALAAGADDCQWSGRIPISEIPVALLDPLLDILKKRRGNAGKPLNTMSPRGTD